MRNFTYMLNAFELYALFTNLVSVISQLVHKSSNWIFKYHLVSSLTEYSGVFGYVLPWIIGKNNHTMSWGSEQPSWTPSKLPNFCRLRFEICDFVRDEQVLKLTFMFVSVCVNHHIHPWPINSRFLFLMVLLVSLLSGSTHICVVKSEMLQNLVYSLIIEDVLALWSGLKPLKFCNSMQ